MSWPVTVGDTFCQLKFSDAPFRLFSRYQTVPRRSAFAINVMEDQNITRGSLMRIGSLWKEYRFFYNDCCEPKTQVQPRKSDMHNRLILPLGWWGELVSGGISGVFACGCKMSCQTRVERGKTKRRERIWRATLLCLHTWKSASRQKPDSFQALSIATDHAVACPDTTCRSAGTSAENLVVLENFHNRWLIISSCRSKNSWSCICEDPLVVSVGFVLFQGIGMLQMW